MKARAASIRPEGERGTAVVEAAITLLLLFVMLFGVMEGGRFLNVQQVVINAAREGARLAVAPLSGTSTMASIGEIEGRVRVYLDAAGIHDATTINIERPVLIQTGEVQSEFTRVRVEVTYQPISLGMFGVLRVPLYGEALMRNETSP